jgi:LPXTG-site transpeptidase (sortase) family protein
LSGETRYARDRSQVKINKFFFLKFFRVKLLCRFLFLTSVIAGAKDKKMQKSVVLFLVGILIVSMLLNPGETVAAQVLAFPAEINKSFSPISIASGGVSRLNVTIYNPNAYLLTNASWTDNLIGVQPGLTIASPVGLTNSCGGSVTAAAGSTTLSVNGATVPAQLEITPGSCTVSINVTSTTAGNLINTIPAGALTSTGQGTIITNTGPASATLNVAGIPVPSVSKSFNPGTIWAGEIGQLSIFIANNHPSTTLTQASLVDNLPANVFLANPVSPTLAGCGGSASLTAVSGGTSVTLNNGTIAPGSTCTIRVNVTSDVQGAYTNRIPANALQTQQGLTNATPATARLNVQEIGLSKRFTPPTFSAGGTTTLIIILQNSTGSPYTGVNFIDNLPAPLTVVSVTANTCGGTTSTTATSVSLTGGTVPAGSPTALGLCTISVQVTAPAGTASGTFTNTIPTGGLTTSQGVGNLRPANANVIVSGTELAGIKSFSPSSIAVGGNSRLRIDIFAPSDTNLTNFSVTDNLPTGVTVSNSTPPAVTGCGPTPPLVFNAPTGATSVSLTNGLVLARQRCRIDVYVTGSTLGLHTNTIPPADITNTENRALTNDLTSTLTVTGGSNLSITLVKGFDPLTVFGGAASTMSIQLINPGTVALTGIAFTDNMPSGMILANPLNFNVGTCGGTLSGVSGTSSFSFSGGNLSASGTCTLTLSATMIVNGNLTNIIPANAVTTLNGASNPDPAEASLTNLPGASVSKFFSSNPIAAGSYSLLTITIQNTGNVSLSRMGLKDTLPGTLPAGLVIANPPAPAPVNNCGGSLAAVAGTQIIELANGSLVASLSCSIVVSVTSSQPGSYQNTISAGTLSSDQGATNHASATDTLVVTDDNPVAGGGGGGRGGNNPTPAASVANANAFLIPVTGFTPAMVTNLDASSHLAYDATSLAIEIPVIQVETSIVGVEFTNGIWDVSWLQAQVGWLNGTAYPTWKGNSVLTAHVVNADGKPGVFSKLKSLGVGEYIFVYNSTYRYTYKVVSNAFVQPDDASVMKHEEKSILTLITCDTYDEKTGTYLRRVVVRAALVDVRPVIR